MLQFLNIFFFVFHTGLVLFNLLGWAWKRTRLLNLITLVGTFAGWSILGIWYGFGYCPCTDWHWQVRSALGYPQESDSYIHFLILKLTGLNLPSSVVFAITAGGFGFAFLMSAALNARQFVLARR